MGKVRVIELGYSQEERIKEVDEQTKKAIRQQYAIEDEIKLLRRAVMALLKGEQPPAEFEKYYSIIEQEVSRGRGKKKQLEAKKIQIRERGGKQNGNGQGNNVAQW